MKKLVLTIVILFTLNASARPARVLVPEQYPTIVQALQSVKNGDTILVAPGNYCERIDFRGKEITLASHFLLDSSLETIRSTILCLPRNKADSGSVVIFQSRESNRAKLTGFTIEGGFGTLIGDSYIGGGILCRSNSHPTICYNIIRNNNALEGGGCAFLDSDPGFFRNQVLNNNALLGGGIYLDNSRTQMEQNIIAYNTATDSGGGLYILLSDGPAIKNTLFYKNSASQSTAIACFFAFPTISHNAFFGHEGVQFGVCLTGLGDTSGYFNYNLIPADQYNNIFRDPQLRNPEGYDFFPLCSSPLIDAGSEPSPIFPLNGPRVDIGFGEFNYLTGDCNSESTFDVSDAICLIFYIFNLSPPPCPLFRGDVNCDRKVDFVDIVHIINYIFKNGPGICQ